MKHYLRSLFLGIALLLVGISSHVRSSAESSESPHQTDLTDTLNISRADAKRGSVLAQTRLCYLLGARTGAPLDNEEAGKWCRLSAEQGHANSQRLLGKAYHVGDGGVERDPKEAERWLLASAKQGNSAAQVDLGGMYYYGDGVAKNLKKAVTWYRKSAVQGNAEAQQMMGFMYDQGYGVLQDDKEAIRWFRMSAEQGNIYAQNSLGTMYGAGEGVRVDRIYAHMWYNIAARDGHPALSDNRRNIEKLMTRDQIIQAQELAKECVKKDYKDC
ncbi:sel1 repeat family protein [Pseudomonadales bacterium]|nr:sel1 repeat family protein [Pseudomonadales bacterium]